MARASARNAPSAPLVAGEEHAPEAKAAHCARCGARFVPTDGSVCAPCVAAEQARRARAPVGYTLCRVVEHVVAVGMVADGHLRTTFEPGEEAIFSDADVLSVGPALVPVP